MRRAVAVLLASVLALVICRRREASIAGHPVETVPAGRVVSGMSAAGTAS
jgi:hypothetical protein